ncbi:MAG: tryptophan-rich sensory protein [Rhodospirillaceae bacterium]|nr:tryptophan-rich sensory protein [Rhodospirillaceae bacterium]
MIDESPKAGRLGAAILAIASVGLTLAVGQIATISKLVPWYESLTKPSFSPPNWVFAPVWSTLYLLMTVAIWRVLCLPRGTQGRRSAVILFFAQLCLNAAWSWMFFGGESPSLGMINIVPQAVLVFLATAVFLRLDRLAGFCLLPLLVWITFAGVLNYEVWRLNN